VLRAADDSPDEQLTRLQPGRIRLSLSPVPESIAAARRAVRALLPAEPRSSLRPRLELVVSELMTNAVTYGDPCEEIKLGLTLYLRHAHVSIHNFGPAIDLARFRQQRADGGRGLVIVAGLVDGWSIETGPTGTTVTARVPRAP
jgi:anti-sigma regulatory factor (Ser/Thr protein kinase)